MTNHQNARLAFYGRLLLVRRVLEEGLRPAEAAQAMGVSRRTVYKCLRRYRNEGKAGLMNRPSTPRHSPLATSDEVQDQSIARRRQRHTFRHIAQALGIGHSSGALGNGALLCPSGHPVQSCIDGQWRLLQIPAL